MTAHTPSTSATATTALPHFTLDDDAGTRGFPSGRPALLCFVHEECETSNVTMPLIEAAHRAFGESIDVWAIGQDAPGNALLVERHGYGGPMLDDSALAVSFRYDIEVVPTIILASPDGEEQRRFIGFGRDDWRDLFDALATIAATETPDIGWDGYPELRPGCGSRSVEPGIAERLIAESEGSPLRARRIEIAEDDDVFEFLFDQGMTDGLPVVPPSPERVVRMLGGTRRDPQEPVAVVPPNMAEATVEKIAINAVMAGCKPEYLPVVLAAIEAVCTDEFNIHGVMATTMGATPVLVVNGPIRHRIGMNMGLGVLGQGNRANSAIGRAVMLTIRNLGGARPGGTERSTFGSPTKYTMAFAEWEERSPWEPMHVERGFAPAESVVTVFGLTGGPHQIVDQRSRTARALAGSIGAGLESSGHPKGHGVGDVLLVVSPEHVDTLSRDGYTKSDLRERIQAVTSRPLRDLVETEDVGGGVPADSLARMSEEERSRLVPKFSAPERIHLVVAGAEAGKWSAFFAGWATGPGGTIVTSRVIEEV